MNYEFATIVIPLAAASTLRELSKMLDRNETDGMFTVGLSASGNLPATHFINSGRGPVEYGKQIRSATLLVTKSKEVYTKAVKPFPFTDKQITDALIGAEISNGTKKVLKDKVLVDVAESPFEMLARLGLKLIRGTI